MMLEFYLNKDQGERRAAEASWGSKLGSHGKDDFHTGINLKEPIWEIKITLIKGFRDDFQRVSTSQ